MKMWTVYAAAAIGWMGLCVFADNASAHGRPHADKVEKEKCCSTCKYNDAMEKMHRDMRITYTGDTDVDFALGMIPHHQGGVDMARIELQYGKDPEMLWLARWIVRGQSVEIGLMKTWVRGRVGGQAPAVDTPETTSYKQAMESMHHAMMISYSGDPDVDFARGMIPHHQGAVDMAKVELASGKNPTMHKLASDIFNSQQQEIAVMQRWLDEHAPAPVAKPTPSKMKKHH